MKPPMNLKELSQHLGLSMTTVSRALGGYPEVSESTRAKVIEAAREFGYRANPNARRLASGKAEAIGMVLPLPPGNFGDPYFAELLAGIGERLQEADIDFMVTAVPAGAGEIEAYQRVVTSRRVDALIVGRTRRQDPRIEYLLDNNFPFIAHGRTETDRPYAWVDVDNEQAFLLATQRLIELGHRRIALINDPLELNFAYLRQCGYERALTLADIAIDPAIVVEGDMYEESGHRLVTELLSADQPPTAILCADVLAAVEALRVIKAKGLEVGKDVSVIAYDDLLRGKYTDPPLTALHQPIRPTGVILAEKLLLLMSGTPVQDLQELWTPELIVRESDGPCGR